ncbi:MAG: peptide deformylase [Lachnospiraceae bacterium]|nr:peptide deformylase [Lachnospiraceae bacterium]
MSVKPLVHDPMFLAGKSEAATPADRQVITDLVDTLQAHIDGCVGMAANMIGVKKNIIVVSMGFMIMPMINAKIISRKGPYPTKEGCLSLLGDPRPTTRYKEIEVEYLDVNFKPKKDKFTDYVAQIIQHELDHVNGVLI